MDFGLVTADEVRDIDFTLPLDGQFTIDLLNNQEIADKPEIRIALDKWGRKEWVGPLYPDRSRERDFLSEYSVLFQTIELNACFYSIPPQDLVRKWKRQIAREQRDNFLFMPKVSRVVSHIKRLHNAEAPMAEFLEAVRLFGENLGPIFLQLGDNFPPKNLEFIEDFIKELPTDLRFFVELRHEDWFSDPENRKAVFSLFKQYHIGAVITDTPGRRDCVHMELTVPEVFVRFNGLGKKFRDMDFKRLDDWAERLQSWVASGLQKVYFTISQKDVDDSPALAEYAINLFNAKLGAGIPTISWKADAPITNIPGITIYLDKEEDPVEWIERLKMRIVKDDDEPN
jgi:uncharacterized protein YecE (DUF72 family)